MAKKEVKKKQKQKPVKKARAVDKWKRKQWFQLIAPAEFDKRVLGETIAEKPKNVVGRTIKVDLGQLSGQRQKKHISLVFQVEQIEGSNAQCCTVGHKVSYGFMNRLIRRRMSKIESNQTVETSDNKRIKIKSVALSVRKLTRKQETSIRKKMVELIEKSAKKKSSVQLCQEIIFGVLASKLFKQLIKIASLKRVEIVKSKLLQGK